MRRLIWVGLLILVPSCTAHHALSTIAEGPSLAFVSQGPGRTLFRVRNGVITRWLAPIPGGRLFASPDGRWIAICDERRLLTSPVQQVLRFKTIARVRATESLGDAIWATDSSALTYTVDDRPSSAHSVIDLYVIHPDGTSRKRVKSFSRGFGVLERFDRQRRKILWFTEAQDGGYLLELMSLDLRSRKVQSLTSKLEPVLPNGLALAPDISRLLYVTDQPRALGIASLDLRTHRKHLLYRIDPVRKDANGNYSEIDSLVLSSDGKDVVFGRSNEPLQYKETTLELSLAGGRAKVILDDDALSNLAPQSWSPNRRYLWMPFLCHGCGGNEGQYYVLDLKTRKPSLMYGGSEGNQVEFVGWLTA
jgi:hypothetical protein